MAHVPRIGLTSFLGTEKHFPVIGHTCNPLKRVRIRA